jgi:RNA polymerase sigma factor (sigma-70 family)
MAALDSPSVAPPPARLRTLSEPTLVSLVAAGSDDAFAVLDARYRPRLERYASGFVPGGRADAEDVAQEALLRAVRALRREGRAVPDAIGPWLYRITRNCALDLVAARRRAPVVADDADHGDPLAEDALDAFERRQAIDALVADVHALPPAQRSALVLRELGGASHIAIARELEVTVPAVKSLLVRARTGLKSARDRRAAAAWLPLPLLSRLLERMSSMAEPVLAGATPKGACVAVVAAGSIPVLAPDRPAPARQPTVPARVAPKPAGPTAPPVKAGVAAAAEPPAVAASTGATVASVLADCADGAIDTAKTPRATLLKAWRGMSAGGREYGSCDPTVLVSAAAGAPGK